MEIASAVLVIALFITGMVMWVRGENAGERKQQGVGIGIVLALLISGTPSFIEVIANGTYKEAFMQGMEEGMNEESKK